MAVVSYGGAPPVASGVIGTDSVVLQGASILDWHRQPWPSHGTDYEYTVHTLRVRALYNPLATSATIAGNRPIQKIGLRASLTDVALRHYLSQYRRQLVVKIGSATVLQSPRPGRTCDAVGGPFVVVNDVSLISGTRTYIVDLTFSVAENECYLFGTNRVLLSHRWTAEHTLDTDYYLTKTIYGRAVFHRGALLALGASADDFRFYLNHNISQGMQRVHVSVHENERGNELVYTVVDREKAQNLITTNNITRVEATHDSTSDVGDAFAPLMQAGLRGARAVGGHQAAVRNAMKEGTPLPGIFGLAKEFLGMGANLITANVPVNQQTCMVHVWGNQDSVRETLMNAAMHFCDWRMQHVRAVSNATSSMLVEDVTGKFATARLTITSGLVNQALQGGAAFRPAWAPRPGKGPARDLPGGLGREITPFIEGTLTPGRVPNPAPPRDFGIRGTLAERLATAALLAPCTVPARPVPPPRAEQFDPT